MSGETVLGLATEVLGWVGCALLIVSILQRRILPLRVLSLISSSILTVYNLVHGVWPMVAMNAAIVVINAVYLARMAVAARALERHTSERLSRMIQ